MEPEFGEKIELFGEYERTNFLNCIPIHAQE